MPGLEVEGQGQWVLGELLALVWGSSGGAGQWALGTLGVVGNGGGVSCLDWRAV